jgi:hypothetical protein
MFSSSTTKKRMKSPDRKFRRNENPRLLLAEKVNYRTSPKSPSLAQARRELSLQKHGSAKMAYDTGIALSRLLRSRLLSDARP